MNNIEQMIDNISVMDYFTKNGRTNNDCFNCKFYTFKNNQSGCSKKYKVEDWDAGIDFMSIDNPDFDSNYGTYRIDENNNPIVCNKFVALHRVDGTKEWKKLKVGKEGKKENNKINNDLGLEDFDFYG